MKRWFVVVLVIMILGGLFYFHFSHKSQKVIETVAVKRGNMTESVEAVGYIEPEHAITVKSQINGIIFKLFHDEGDYVKKGEPLVEIKPAPEPAVYAETYQQLKEAESVERLAAQDFYRYQEALKKGLITKNYVDYVEAKRSWETAKVQKKLAAQQLALLNQGHATVGGKLLANIVKSPINGYILDRAVDVGDPVISLSSAQASTPLFSMANMHDLIFEGTVDEVDSAKIKQNMLASLTVGAAPDQKISGRLSKIALQAESSDEAEELASPFNVGFRVEIKHLKIPTNIALRSGYSATASILIRTLKNILMLPATVIHFENGESYVFLPAAEKPEKHFIKVGVSDGMNIQVLKGLEEGDQVIKS